MSLFRSNRDDDAFGMLEDEQPRRRLLSPEMQIAIAFGVTLVVGVVCGGALIWQLRPNADNTQNGSAADTEVPTAREAFEAALVLVHETDPGALLMSSVGVWNPVIDDTLLNAGRTSWTFHFYLPETAEMIVIGVGRGKTPIVVRTVEWGTPPAILNAQGWLIDSTNVVEPALAACADALEDNPDASMEFRLSTAVENRSILWQAHVLSDDPLVACEVFVDGTTGLIR